MVFFCVLRPSMRYCLVCWLCVVLAKTFILPLCLHLQAPLSFSLIWFVVVASLLCVETFLRSLVPSSHSCLDPRSHNLFSLFFDSLVTWSLCLSLAAILYVFLMLHYLLTAKLLGRYPSFSSFFLSHFSFFNLYRGKVSVIKQLCSVYN